MDISFLKRGIKVPKRKPVFDIADVETPHRAILVMAQEAGVECKPTVKRGQTVERGAVVGEDPEGETLVHTPIGGLVAEVGAKVISPQGVETRTVVVERGDEELQEPVPAWKDDEQDLLERLRLSGVLTSCTQPLSLYRTLKDIARPRSVITATSREVRRGIDHIAVRLTEFDPHLCALDAQSAHVNLEHFSAGIDQLVELTGARQVWLIEDKNIPKKNYEKLESLAEDRAWEIVAFDSRRYPAFSDAIVGKRIIGREPPVALQNIYDSGVLVVDISTVLDVRTALVENRPITEKTITVTGPGGTKVVRAAIGTPYADILAAAGEDGDYGKVILGGPLRGRAHHTLEYPLTRDVEAITLVSRGDVVLHENRMCISCGLCAMACPMRLSPGLLSRYCEFGQWEEADKTHLFNCIECGVCAYVCPAGRSMVQLMVLGKTEVSSRRNA